MSVRPKLPPVRDPQYKGEVKNSQSGQTFAKPLTNYSHSPEGMDSLTNDIGERSGFQIDGYLDKNGMVYGEGAKLNFLPPGMDISNQENADIRDLPLKTVTAESYPGDGWEPTPRDVQEGTGLPPPSKGKGGHF